jgi:phosphate/sulfate permease
MGYTLFAIACYIVMRGLQVLFEEKLQARWCKVLIKTVTVIMLYAALASLITWYKGIPFLGFSPK